MVPWKRNATLMIILSYTVLYYTILEYTILHNIPYDNILYCTIPYLTIPYKIPYYKIPYHAIPFFATAMRACLRALAPAQKRCAASAAQWMHTLRVPGLCGIWSGKLPGSIVRPSLRPNRGGVFPSLTLVVYTVFIRCVELRHSDDRRFSSAIEWHAAPCNACCTKPSALPWQSRP